MFLRMKKYPDIMGSLLTRTQEAMAAQQQAKVAAQFSEGLMKSHPLAEGLLKLPMLQWMALHYAPALSELSRFKKNK